jgi:hypothetical protein
MTEGEGRIGGGGGDGGWRKKKEREKEEREGQAHSGTRECDAALSGVQEAPPTPEHVG